MKHHFRNELQSKTPSNIQTHLFFFRGKVYWVFNASAPHSERFELQLKRFKGAKITAQSSRLRIQNEKNEDFMPKGARTSGAVLNEAKDSTA